MIEYVVDTSAVLAVLRHEPGREKVEPRLSRSVVSTVNLAEVVTVLARGGSSSDEIADAVALLPLMTEALDAAQAYFAGNLAPLAEPRGLSLGDRCCLALAHSRALPVLTSDRRWAELTLDVQVELIR